MIKKTANSFISVIAWTILLLASQPVFAVEPVLDSVDPYEILGVDPTIDEEGLTGAWRDLLKIHHPDTGGEVKIAQIVNEAYQFLKKHRINYDRRLFPFRGYFKKSETRPVPLTYDEEIRFQSLYHSYLRREKRARAMAGPNPEARPVFLLYAILNLEGDHSGYLEFEAWQLRAYRELLFHLNLSSLTNSEMAGIFLHDPVEALESLLQYYDNFTVRLSTLTDLFAAYDHFYLDDDLKSKAFLELIEGMDRNQLLHDRRFNFVRVITLIALKDWLRFYLQKNRRERRPYREQYQRTKNLVFSLEPFPNSWFTCSRLLLGIKPKID